MGRCSYDKLKHIEPVLDQIRKLENLKEPKPGIFYIKSDGFMHFHEKDGKIWADVKDGEVWGKPLDVPEKLTKKFATSFVKEVSKRYKNTIS